MGFGGLVKFCCRPRLNGDRSGGDAIAIDNGYIGGYRANILHAEPGVKSIVAFVQKRQAHVCAAAGETAIAGVESKSVGAITTHHIGDRRRLAVRGNYHRTIESGRYITLFIPNICEREVGC